MKLNKTEWKCQPPFTNYANGRRDFAPSLFISVDPKSNKTERFQKNPEFGPRRTRHLRQRLARSFDFRSTLDRPSSVQVQNRIKPNKTEWIFQGVLFVWCDECTTTPCGSLKSE
jgi:hypothetical protein